MGFLLFLRLARVPTSAQKGTEINLLYDGEFCGFVLIGDTYQISSTSILKPAYRAHSKVTALEPA